MNVRDEDEKKSEAVGKSYEEERKKKERKINYILCFLYSKFHLSRIAQKVFILWKKKLSIANRYARMRERERKICIKNDKATKERTQREREKWTQKLIVKVFKLKEEFFFHLHAKKKRKKRKRINCLIRLGIFFLPLSLCVSNICNFPLFTLYIPIYLFLPLSRSLSLSLFHCWPFYNKVQSL